MEVVKVFFGYDTGAHISKVSRRHLKILVASSVTWINFHTEKSPYKI